VADFSSGDHRSPVVKFPLGNSRVALGMGYVSVTALFAKGTNHLPLNHHFQISLYNGNSRAFMKSNPGKRV
jgi:hypothetical protein